MVPRGPRGDGPDGPRCRGADEADADVPTLLQRRAESRKLACLAHQAGRTSRSGLRLVSGSGGDGGACVDRCRGCRCSVRTSHAVAFFELLGGGKQDAGWYGSGMPDARLAILPGTTHYGIFFSPALAATVSPFLDTPEP